MPNSIIDFTLGKIRFDRRINALQFGMDNFLEFFRTRIILLESPQGKCADCGKERSKDDYVPFWDAMEEIAYHVGIVMLIVSLILMFSKND